MPNATSAVPGGVVPDWRVIYHARTCPDCASDQITEQDIQTTDGLTETALTCQACGAAWPVACIAEHLGVRS